MRFRCKEREAGRTLGEKLYASIYSPKLGNNIPKTSALVIRFSRGIDRGSVLAPNGYGRNEENENGKECCIFASSVVKMWLKWLVVLLG